MTRNLRTIFKWKLNGIGFQTFLLATQLHDAFTEPLIIGKLDFRLEKLIMKQTVQTFNALKFFASTNIIQLIFSIYSVHKTSMSSTSHGATTTKTTQKCRGIS